MEYLLKVTVVIGIFYTCYKVFLQRETFFEANRWFLLTGLITAILIPFLTIPIYIEQAPISLDNFEFTEVVTAIQPVEESINWQLFLNIGYFFGVFAFSIRFLIQSSSLIKLLAKNKSHKKGAYNYIKTSAVLSPFSFFKWIVYNPTQFSEIELEQILNHEKVHARQYHSIDILLTQLSCIVFWFNPFVWFYNKDLKQNLEFIADKLAQKGASSKKSYQCTLLKTSISAQTLVLTNNFYNSLIKKRIAMLQKSESKKINQYKYLLILPLLIAFVLNYNTKVIAQEINPKTPSQENNKTTIGSSETFVKIISKDFQKKDFESLQKILLTNDISLSYDDLKYNSNNELIKVTLSVENKRGNTSATWEEGKNPIPTIMVGEIDGRVIAATSYLNSKQKNAAINLAPLKENSLTNQDAIEVYIDQKNTPKSIVVGHSEKTLKSTNKFQQKDLSENYKAIITKDHTDDDFDKIKKQAKLIGIVLKFKKIKRNSKNEIISISAEFKNKNGSGTYSPKGKNPIKPFAFEQTDNSFGFGPSIKQKTNNFSQKEKAPNNQKQGFRINKRGLLGRISLGKPQSRVTDRFLKSDYLVTKQPSPLASIRIGLPSTGSQKTPLNEEKIVVTGYNLNKEIPLGNQDHINASQNDHEKYRITAGYSLNGIGIAPLIIVDGKETSKNINDLDANDIHSITVLKDESATKIYGNKGKNGVILITTKNNAPKQITIRGTRANGKQPILIINGKKTSKKIEDIDQQTIHSINVLKGEKAIEKYGRKAEDGIVEITTKKRHNIHLSENTSPINSIVILKGKEPIYEINGIESTKKQALKIKSNEFKSITALSGKDAIKKYGEKGKNGVMVISTNK